MALYVVQGRDALKRGAILGPDYLEKAWYTALFPFVAPYLPIEIAAKFSDLESMPRPLGLILTRATANLLSDARAPLGADAHWRAALGLRAVYIDVPHGAVLIGARPDGSDILELRAIFIVPLAEREVTPALFITVLTDRGSERPRGRVCGKIECDGRVLPVFWENGAVAQPDPTLQAPCVDSSTEARVRERSADFLRLVMAYYFFGPVEAREPIAATASERLLNGKPRKNESLFAMMRLQPARDRLGRPAASIPESWSMSTRQEVSGHFRLQPYGPAASLRRLIWVHAYERGPEGAIVKAGGIKL